MEKHILHGLDGNDVAVYPLGDFKAATIAYRYDPQYREFLDHQWSKGKSAEEAIAALRAECGAMTKAERASARSRNPVKLGRPRQVLSIGEAKARLAATLFDTIAMLERREMTAETRELLNGMKQQLAAW